MSQEELYDNISRFRITQKASGRFVTEYFSVSDWHSGATFDTLEAAENNVKKCIDLLKNRRAERTTVGIIKEYEVYES